MSSKDFPGFEDASPSPTPSAPAPAPASPPPLAPYAFEDEAPAPVAAPVPKPKPVMPAPVAPVPVRTPDPEPEDVKPGSAKDLWKCPHCGAGNKPQRTTCRSCGKSPTDPVARPWFLRPPVLAAAVVLVIAAVVGWKVTRPDLTLRPADAAHVDKSVRSGGGRLPEVEVEGRTFTPRKQISVVGRVIGQRTHPSVSSVTSVALALGPAAKDGAFEQMSVAFNGERTEVSGGSHVVLHLLRPVTVPERGGYLSVGGQAGVLADGLVMIQSLDDGLVVLPTPAP